MRTLHTPCCLLEPQGVAHAPEMFEVLCDPALYEFEGEPPPSLERLVEGFRRKEARVSPDGLEGWLNWVVRLHITGELTGYVQATVLGSGAAYIGYEFASRYWRLGLARHSVTAVLRELATQYGVHTAVAVLKQANFRSLGLLQALGFLRTSPEDAAAFEHDADEIVMHLRLPPETAKALRP